MKTIMRIFRYGGAKNDKIGKEGFELSAKSKKEKGKGSRVTGKKAVSDKRMGASTSSPRPTTRDHVKMESVETNVAKRDVDVKGDENREVVRFVHMEVEEDAKVALAALENSLVQSATQKSPVHKERRVEKTKEEEETTTKPKGGEEAAKNEQQDVASGTTQGNRTRSDSYDGTRSELVALLKERMGNSYHENVEPTTNYTVMRQIGVGSYGDVRYAIKNGYHDLDVYAIKVVPKIHERAQLKTDVDLAMLAYQEALNLFSLRDHKNILHLYEVYDTERKLYLVTNYAYNGSLYDRIVETKNRTGGETSGLGHAFMGKVFRQVASALDYAHSLSICHRDLKPENILLDDQDNAIVADWGFSRRFEEDALVWNNCGSVHYVSPEILQQIPHRASAPDSWALGNCLYNMLTGTMLFYVARDEPKYTRTSELINNATLRFSDCVKERERSLIGSLMCKDWKERMTPKEFCSSGHQFSWECNTSTPIAAPAPEKATRKGGPNVSSRAKRADAVVKNRKGEIVSPNNNANILLYSSFEQDQQLFDWNYDLNPEKGKKGKKRSIEMVFYDL